MSKDLNKPTLGITIFLGSLFVSALMSMCSKLLTEAGHLPVEILFYRNIIGLFIISAYLITQGRTEEFKTKRPKMHFIRSFIGYISALLSLWAYSLLPLATVSGILLITPALATALSAPFLGEKVNPIRWFTVFAGLLGALIITQPGTNNFDPSYTIALLAAFSSAGVALCLRTLGTSESSLTTTFYFFAFGTVLTGIVVPFVWTGLPSNNILLAGVVLSGIGSQVLKASSYQYAEASLLSPFKYFKIVWATLLGFLIWKEIPDAHIYNGCAIIITSNLLILLWEKFTKNKFKEAAV